MNSAAAVSGGLSARVAAADVVSPRMAGMEAFALPSFSEGYVRLNVRGREARASSSPPTTTRSARRSSAELHRLTDARTGSLR